MMLTDKLVFSQEMVMDLAVLLVTTGKNVRHNVYINSSTGGIFGCTSTTQADCFGSGFGVLVDWGYQSA